MKTLSLSSLLLVAAAGLAATARAQETCPCPPPAPPEPAWKTRLGLAYLATSGNSESETLGASLLVTRRPEPWGLEIAGSYDRAEADGVVESERVLARARVRRTLGESWELFGEASGEQNEQAGIDQRLLVSAGATFHALTGPEHLLDFDAGITWTDEDRVAPAVDESFTGGLAGLRYEWKFSEHASFRQTLVGYWSFEESDDWRLESLTALEAALNSRLALQLSYELRFDNLPIGDLEDTDTTTRVALVLDL
jgi:putative salt-induced outer membrane protein